VRIYDDRDQYGKAAITVLQDPCRSAEACNDGQICAAGQCVLGPGVAGGLGDRCAGDEDCATAMCAFRGNRPGVCTSSCEYDPAGCPLGFECADTNDGGKVCIPALVEPDAGCSASGASGGGIAASWALLLLLAAACGTRRPHGQERDRRAQS
jgi:hypothetical protein